MSAELPGTRVFGGGPIGGPVAALRAGSFRRLGQGFGPNLQTTPVVLAEPNS